MVSAHDNPSQSTAENVRREMARSLEVELRDLGFVHAMDPGKIPPEAPGTKQ